MTATAPTPSSQPADTNDLGASMRRTYPYVESQTVWGHPIQLFVASARTADWYGLDGYRRRCGGDPDRARAALDGWDAQLRMLMHPGDVVIDCGANEGHTTAVFARQVGPTGKVIAIEPSAANVTLLRHNVTLNSLSNVLVLKKVAAEHSGAVQFFRDEIVQADDGPRAERVETVCLDDLIDLRPTVVKIDVEGYELPVLRGARRLLAAGARFEIEVHLASHGGVNMRDRFGFEPDELLQLLWSYDYSVRSPDGELSPGAVLGNSTHLWCTPWITPSA